MTEPVEPSRPDEEPERPSSAQDAPTAAQPRPDLSRSTPTGWGGPQPSRPGPAGSSTPGSGTPRPGPTSLPTPGSAYVPQRPSAPAAAPPSPASSPSSGPAQPTSATPPAASAPAAPVRPPVPTGVPPRPNPLPPPRTTAARPDVAGSLGPATVVPEKAPRRPAPRPAGSAAPRGRRAKLAVKRLDPWSVFVTSLMLSLLLAVVTIVAAFLLYAVLSAMGVPQSINSNVGDITKKGDILTRGKFLGVAALIAGANVLFLTALATLGSMLYNLVATFTGGLELTLSERD